MPIKFLYSLFCLLTGVLSAMSSRAAGPGVINLLPSDYRAANKNWAVAEDDAGTLYAGNDKGLLEFDGLQWRLYELPRASIVRSVAPLSHDVIFTGGFEEFGRWDRDASGALRYTSLVPAQRNPRFSDSDFWKIYITTDFFSENTDGACGNRKESADTFHKYRFARAIISYNAVNLSHL